MKAKKVFKQIFRHPAPMRRIDDYLLKHYPQVWRLRVHYVLVYWLLAGILLFIAGYSMPIGFDTYINNPKYYANIEIVMSLCIAGIGLFSLFFWRKNLLIIQQSAYRWYITLYEIFLYTFCIYLIFLSINAFYCGITLKKNKIRDEAVIILKSDLFVLPKNINSESVSYFDSINNQLSEKNINRSDELFRALYKNFKESRYTNYIELSLNSKKLNESDDTLRSKDIIEFFKNAKEKFFSQKNELDSIKIYYFKWYIVCAIYSALLLFFLCNSDLVLMVRSSFFISILTIGAIIIDFREPNISRTISLFFISGFPAITTIVLLIILRYRLVLPALLALVQIVLSFSVITTLDTAFALSMHGDDFGYNNREIYALAYWCILLIVIAVLYRRHLTLPEKE